MESIAAPKTEGGAISLGAIDLGGSKNTPSTTDTPKPVSGGRSRRNRASGARPGKVAPASSSKEFVPHPIEIKPSSAEDKKDA